MLGCLARGGTGDVGHLPALPSRDRLSREHVPGGPKISPGGSGSSIPPSVIWGAEMMPLGNVSSRASEARRTVPETGPRAQGPACAHLVPQTAEPGKPGEEGGR